MKIDIDQVKESIKWHPQWTLGTLQTIMFVASGGGFIGKSFAERPTIAYRDTRAGRAPYKAKEIENIRLTLIAFAEAKGYNPNDLPPMPDFHNCGVF